MLQLFELNVRSTVSEPLVLQILEDQINYKIEHKKYSLLKLLS